MTSPSYWVVYADACRRWLGERVGSWATWCLPAVRVEHAWALGLVGRLVALSGLLRWSPSGPLRDCYAGDRCSAERLLTARAIRVARSSAHLRLPVDLARSPMPRDWLLPSPHARLSAPLLHTCLACRVSILFRSKNHDTPKSLHNFTISEPCRNN